jgi:hypothetical protein
LIPVIRIVIESGFLNAAYFATYVAVLCTRKGAGGIGVIATDGKWLFGVLYFDIK